MLRHAKDDVRIFNKLAAFVTLFCICSGNDTSYYLHLFCNICFFLLGYALKLVITRTSGVVVNTCQILREYLLNICRKLMHARRFLIDTI